MSIDWISPTNPRNIICLRCNIASHNSCLDIFKSLLECVCVCVQRGLKCRMDRTNTAPQLNTIRPAAIISMAVGKSTSNILKFLFKRMSAKAGLIQIVFWGCWIVPWTMLATWARLAGFNPLCLAHSVTLNPSLAAPVERSHAVTLNPSLAAPVELLILSFIPSLYHNSCYLSTPNLQSFCGRIWSSHSTG